jgi:tRNA A-37 threonylcarbamoyl transferase component Bud32
MSPEPDQLAAEGLTWRVDPALADWLRTTLAPAARAPESLPGAAVIKHNRVRSVVRVEAPGGALYVKRFRLLRCVDRLAHLVRATAARREWTALRAVARAGIPCPAPVVLGEEKRGGLVVGSVLATREVAGARELTLALDQARAAGASREPLLTPLARIVRRLFEAGVDHPDLHLGNFLLAPDGELVALDLHSARLRRGPLGASARRARLGKLAHSLGLFDPGTAAWATDELQAFAGAWAALDPALGPADALRDDLRRRARRIESARLASRDKRCLVDSTSFAVEGPRGRRTWRRRDVPPAAIEALLEAPAELVIHAHPRGRSRLEVVSIPAGTGLMEALGPATQLVRKRYPFPTLRSRVEGALDPTPLRAWRAARACDVRNVPHPRHLAVVVEGWPAPRRATIFMELVAPATMIHVALEATPGLTPAARRTLARDAGTALGRFHASGLKHRDLAVQNLLVRPRSDGWDVWVVDLDEVRPGAMTREERLRALTQLADLPRQATRADRGRFWRAYLDAGGREVLAAELETLGARGLGREVARRLEARMRAKAARAARRIERPAPTRLPGS